MPAEFGNTILPQDSTIFFRLLAADATLTVLNNCIYILTIKRFMEVSPGTCKSSWLMGVGWCKFWLADMVWGMQAWGLVDVNFGWLTWFGGCRLGGWLMWILAGWHGLGDAGLGASWQEFPNDHARHELIDRVSCYLGWWREVLQEPRWVTSVFSFFRRHPGQSMEVFRMVEVRFSRYCKFLWSK